VNTALRIQVKGIVQGVGFRPFVYRQAKKHIIAGWVLNAADGVTIHAEGEENLVDEFVLALANNAPAAARVDEITMAEVPLEGFTSFEIRFSDEAAVQETTLISPDLALCEDCQRELFDGNDRRYRYPFINCTNCGPRFTIIDGLPYDRAQTSMQAFEMCPACAAEYVDPANRRFHAQPDACFDCGPTLSFVSDAERIEAHDLQTSDACLAAAVAVLQAGGIVAVKGLGGFHLVCDAQNPQALETLRSRKHRNGKGFAVMMENVDAVRAFCHVNADEERLLTGSVRPIVLLKKRKRASFAAGLADGLPELGVMLPYTPVQALLMHDFVQAGGTMLVMTSGNYHDEPIVTDNDEALERLGGIADAFLLNNRDILARYDDSVVRVLSFGGFSLSVRPDGEQANDVPAEGMCAVQMVRRARGYAPQPLTLPADLHRNQALFAAGPEQKNTFTMVRGNQAFVSQHIGDLENAETFDAWMQVKGTFSRLFDMQPQSYACDLHPEYLSTKWVREQSTPDTTTEVQHHHAHIVSVMGEHNLTGPVCGIAFDGTGYGADGAIWGGEVLLCNLSDYERFANMAYVPMPGGAAAVKHPLRMAYGILWECDLLEHPQAQKALAPLADMQDMLESMIDKGINTPYTSSVGRLFDAASALLGVCPQPTYEGEAAIALEACMAEDDEEPFQSEAAQEATARYAMQLVKNVAQETSTAHDTSVVLFDNEPTFRALLDDAQAGVPVGIIALRFHRAFVQAIVDIAHVVESMYGIDTVVLSGGVFMNRYLMEHVLPALSAAGMKVAINADLPPNDGCISYGQAVIASAAGQNVYTA